jgi:hypothetical protein
MVSTVQLNSSIWLLVAWAILGRIGLGFILPSLNLGSMRGLPHGLIPQGSSVINFLRMLGGAVGVSLCGIALEWRLAAHGDALGNPASSPARLAAFNEVFPRCWRCCARWPWWPPGSCATVNPGIGPQERTPDRHVPAARHELQHADGRDLQLRRLRPARRAHRPPRRRLGHRLLRGARRTAVRGPPERGGRALRWPS